MEYYSTLKRNELVRQGKTWKNLKYILLSERNQSEKVTCCIIPSVLHFGRDKMMETIKRSVVTRVYGTGERRINRG